MNKQTSFLHGLFLCWMAISSLTLQAQVPQGINYQAVLRDGSSLYTQPVNVQFDIINASGAITYSEVHAGVQPDPGTGVVNLIIGEGTPLTGTFPEVNWADGQHQLLTSVQEPGGSTNSFGPVATQSVPYSLVAQEAIRVPTITLDSLTDVQVGSPATGDVLTWDGNEWTPQLGGNGPWQSTSAGINYNQGNVGILRADPLARLHVNGDLALQSPNNHTYRLQVNNDGDLQFVGDGNEWMTITDQNGRVGIGTTSPSAGFELHDKDFLVTDPDGDSKVRLEHNYTGDAGGVLIYDNTGNLRIEMQAQETSTTGAEINLRDANGNQTIVLDADFNGNGRIITDELQILGGSDFAENFDLVDPDLAVAEPGMIVSIDPNSTGKLMVASEAYDRKVAGVISGANGIKPGMTMGQEETIADGEFPVALTGRVYVWADAAYGAIEPGDLLTSSPTAGHAQKVVNHKKATGAVIGKAMTRLTTGKGYVLVLINLQ